jgi:hypothetical protein
MDKPPAMKASTIHPPNYVKPKPGVDIETLTSFSPEFLEDSYVYVHCNFKNDWTGLLIRIWKTTYLIDEVTKSRSKLVHVENISIAPQWTPVPDRQEYSFLLIFETLPSSCKMFHLLEDISQPGGFYIGNIKRNHTDVYHVPIF